MYYDSQDTEQELSLDQVEAAKLQLGGHVIVDENGDRVTLLAKDIIDNDSLPEQDQVPGDHVKETEGEEPEGDEDADVKGADERSDEDKQTEAEKNGHPKGANEDAVNPADEGALHSEEDGPANAENQKQGYKPTGL